MLLSVIVPCYNYAYNLEKLCKVLALEYGDFAEIIFVNDGSTDSTKEVCEQLAEKHSCLRVVHQENQGASVARKTGQEAAETDWIYYIDADDLPVEGSGQAVKEILEAKPDEDILIAGYISVSKSGKEKLQLPSKQNWTTLAAWIKAYWNKELSIVNGGTVLRKSLFEQVTWDRRFRTVEDILFYSHCLAKFKARVIDLALCKVIHHDGSLRHNVDDAAEQIPNFIETLFTPGALPEELYSARSAYHAQRHLSASRLYFLQGEKQKGREQYRKALEISKGAVFKFSYLKKYLKSFL